ncbi:hypothetical protein M0657_004080 [Pyricularia oryzae]|nr:hypothetical protein M9X92_005466 [Pyricularia oryzae]KAI7925765.1 hypothetical protein M0657_004080 [Pyricularia oryzae]
MTRFWRGPFNGTACQPKKKGKSEREPKEGSRQARIEIPETEPPNLQSGPEHGRPQLNLNILPKLLSASSSGMNAITKLRDNAAKAEVGPIS